MSAYPIPSVPFTSSPGTLGADETALADGGVRLSSPKTPATPSRAAATLTLAPSYSARNAPRARELFEPSRNARATTVPFASVSSTRASSSSSRVKPRAAKLVVRVAFVGAARFTVTVTAVPPAYAPVALSGRKYPAGGPSTYSKNANPPGPPRGGPGGFAFFEYVEGPPAGYFRPDNATGAYAGGTAVTVTVNRAAPTNATRTTSFAARGLTRLELDDARVELTLANGTVVARAFLEGSNSSRARGAFLAEYDGASVSVAAARDGVAGVFGEERRTPPSASAVSSAPRVPGELVNGTDGIGYALIDASYVRANVTFLERFEDTEPADAYRPFQPSERVTCEFFYDHLGPHDAVFNLTGETRLNASEIRARAAGTFYGDCHADCVLDAELENHVEFLGNFSWRGNCSIPVVNLTALNVTLAERIAMFGESWEPYDAPRVRSA